MSKRTDKRAKARAQKRSQKEARMKKAGAKSDYAIKHAEQARGRYRPTSPFYLSPAERARLEALESPPPAPESENENFS